jgi:hypothetical protein
LIVVWIAQHSVLEWKLRIALRCAFARVSILLSDAASRPFFLRGCEI